MVNKVDQLYNSAVKPRDLRHTWSSCFQTARNAVALRIWQ